MASTKRVGFGFAKRRQRSSTTIAPCHSFGDYFRQGEKCKKTRSVSIGSTLRSVEYNVLNSLHQRNEYSQYIGWFTKIANEELNEVPSRIEEVIRHIREWIEKQPHLSIRTDDQYLLSFLRGCKFNLQKTKQKLDFFYAMRTVVPEFFAKRDPFSQDVKQIFKMGAVSMLLQSPDSIEAPFFFLRWKYCDIETMTLSSILKATLISMDIAMIEDDNVIISGVRYIVDFTNFPVKYALQFIPSIVKKFVLCVENAYPIRIKAVYVVNAPAIFDTVYSVFKPFLSKKLKNRMHIYKEGEINKFHEEISSNILPKEYGGNQSSFSNIADPWIRKVESYREWLLEDDKYRSNERLRPESSKEFIYDTLNMEGSFRKLNID